MIDVPLHNVTLAVLAGGEGARMGRPKGMLEIKGRPILAYQLEQIRWVGPTLLVTAPGREKPPGYELFSREVVDAVAGEGPLRGVLTALKASETEIVTLTTVDMPEVRREHLEYLVAQLRARTGANGVMLTRSGRVEPFPCAFRRGAAVMIEQRLRSGILSVHSLAKETEIVTIECPAEWPQRVWTNLNRPEELRDWLLLP